jgi:hypothetical protein
MHHAYDLMLLEAVFPHSHHPVLNMNISFKIWIWYIFAKCTFCGPFIKPPELRTAFGMDFKQPQQGTCQRHAHLPLQFDDLRHFYKALSH